MQNATLYRMPSRPTVQTEEGGEAPASDQQLLNRGVKVVGTESGDEIAHVAPGVDPSEVLPDDSSQIMAPGWEWSDLPDQASDVAESVLEAVWTERVDGEEVRRRGPQGPARGRGNIPAVIAEDLPPHMWAGDE